MQHTTLPTEKCICEKGTPGCLCRARGWAHICHTTPTKESGEWGKQKVIELLAKIADNAEKNKGQLASSFLEECETYLVSLLANAEKRAREEGYQQRSREVKGPLELHQKGIEQAYQRGADEMVERTREATKKGFCPKCHNRMKNILTSLRSLQKEKP